MCHVLIARPDHHRPHHISGLKHSCRDKLCSWGGVCVQVVSCSTQLPTCCPEKMPPEARCHWLVLAGDSNTRQLLGVISSMMAITRPRWRLRQWPHMLKGSVACSRCSATHRTFDREHLHYDPAGRGCLLISFRFLIAPRELARVATWVRVPPPRVCADDDARRLSCRELRTFGNCTRRLTPRVVVPRQPDFVHFSPGLTGLPKAPVACARRFEAEVSACECLSVPVSACVSMRH